MNAAHRGDDAANDGLPPNGRIETAHVRPKRPIVFAGWDGAARVRRLTRSGAPGQTVGAPLFVFYRKHFEKIRSRGMVLPIAGIKARLIAPRESDRFQPCAADLLTRSKRRRAKGFLKTSAWHWGWRHARSDSKPESVPSGRPCRTALRKALRVYPGDHQVRPGDDPERAQLRIGPRVARSSNRNLMAPQATEKT